MEKQTVYAIKLEDGLYAKEKVLGKDVYIHGTTLLLNATTFETEEDARYLANAIVNNDDGYFNFITKHTVESIVKFEVIITDIIAF